MVTPSPAAPVVDRNRIIAALVRLQHQQMARWKIAMKPSWSCRSGDLSHLFVRKLFSWSIEDWLELVMYFLPPAGLALKKLALVACESLNLIKKNPDWNLIQVEQHLLKALR